MKALDALSQRTHLNKLVKAALTLCPHESPELITRLTAHGLLANLT